MRHSPSLGDGDEESAVTPPMMRKLTSEASQTRTLHPTAQSGDVGTSSTSPSADFSPYTIMSSAPELAQTSDQHQFARDQSEYYRQPSATGSGSPSSQQTYYPIPDLSQSPPLQSMQSYYPDAMSGMPTYAPQQFASPSFAPQQHYQYHSPTYIANTQQAQSFYLGHQQQQQYQQQQQPPWAPSSPRSNQHYYRQQHQQQQQYHQSHPHQQQQYPYQYQPIQHQYAQQVDYNTPRYWRPNQYPFQPGDPSQSRVISGSNQSGVRLRSSAASGLPNRPSSVNSGPFLSLRSASGATDEHADRGIGPSSVPASGIDAMYTNLDARVPGKGLRQHYHPQQGPRSEHVLWCGNVPSDASVEELWSFFSMLPPESTDLSVDPGEELRKELLREGESADASNQALTSSDPALSPTSGHGVLSVFIIARSNCAFVNYASDRHLQRAVSHFHGQSLRPVDPRCPRLVCRVRKKDDEAQAGVAGQRGRGIHVAWVKEQDRKMKQDARPSNQAIRKEDDGGSASIPTSIVFDERGVDANNDAPSKPPLQASETTAVSLAAPSKTLSSVSAGSMPSDEKRLSVSTGDGSSGSISFTSTNSSLFRHPAFHERFFILKSLGTDDLDRSIETGLWATQPHNEQVLDQAFRNSQSVYLIFSANQSGGFYGYARMAGAILSSREVQQQRQTESGTILPPLASQGTGRTSTLRPEAIPEATEELDRQGNVDQLTSEARKLSDPGSFLPVEGKREMPMTSPLQLTPAGEIDSPMAKLSAYDSQSWPPQKQNAQGEEPKVQSYTSEVIRTRTASTDEPQSETKEMQSTSLGSEPSGTKRKDFAQLSRSAAGASSSSLPARTPLSDSGSLGPGDSVSLDAKSQQQLAIRAMIHNLRLEEKESQMKADVLERTMNEQSDSTKEQNLESSSGEMSAEYNTPRAGSSDSWGKPFKVEWIKTSPISFNQVRKLRNPWRDNRQVKVSRDGTELEPNVGRLLLKEWDRSDVETSNITPLQGTSTHNAGPDGEEEEV